MDSQGNSKFYRKRRHPKELQKVGYYVTESRVVNCNRCSHHNRGTCVLHAATVELQGRCSNWHPRYNQPLSLGNQLDLFISEPYKVGVISMSGIPNG